MFCKVFLRVYGFIVRVVSGMGSKEKEKCRVEEGRQGVFVTPEARRIGDQLLLFQRETGGWPKNIDMVTPLNDEERAEIEAEKRAS